MQIRWFKTIYNKKKYIRNNGQTPYLFFFGLLGGGYMVGQFAAIALATKLTKKIPKEKAFFMVNLLSVIAIIIS